MCSRVCVLIAVLVFSLELVGANNDVFPEEEEETQSPTPHQWNANDVFPLREEVLDQAPLRKHSPRHRQRVHNLVLSPQQNSMCELRPIRQIVTHAHCTSKEMENNVCVGTCFSYTVPQTEPETPGDEMLDHCDSCQASESHWTTIQLDCEEYGNIYQVTKKIQMISNCSCSPCYPPRGQHQGTENEVTYPASEHRISESFYKLFPEGLQRTEINSELEFTKASLDELRKSVYIDPQQEEAHGKVVLKMPASFTGSEEEVDPNDVVSY